MKTSAARASAHVAPALAALLEVRTGLSFGRHRHADLEDAALRASVARRCAGLDEYVELVARDPGAFDELAAALTIGETYFFRHVEQFTFLESVVVPALLERRPPGAVLRVWSAGCATGEEAYSLAMSFARMGLLSRVAIVGTDLSPVALRTARAGVYRRWSVRGRESDAALPFLEPQGAGFRVRDDLRRHVRFTAGNLVARGGPLFPEPGPVDVIMCRNVLIYFSPEGIRAAAATLTGALAHDGSLLTSPTDPCLAELAPLEMSVSDGTVAYRHAADAPGPRPPWAPEPRPGALPGLLEALLEPPGLPGLPEALPEPLVEAPPPEPLVEATPFAPFLPPPAVWAWQAPAPLPPGEADELAEMTRLLGKGVVPAAAARVHDAAMRHPWSCALHHLDALAALELRRWPEAIAAARRVLYLDRSIVVAHLTLATALQGAGAPAAARVALRAAAALAEAQPPDDVQPLGGGETAGRLAALARQHLALLA